METSGGGSAGFGQDGGNQPARKNIRYALTREGIFAYDLVLLAVLVVLGACYISLPQFLPLGGDPYKLAIESMWFGSLGGVIISLKGIYDHSTGPDAWDPSYNLWHLGRPASGAVAGLMTVVLLEVANNGSLTRPVVFAAAFIFGTQERRFFNFLYEVARLIVQVPQEAKSDLQIHEVEPSEGTPGSVIVIKGQGIEPNAAVKLGSNPVKNLVFSSDGTTAAGVIPSQSGDETVDVTVTNPGGKTVTLPTKFKFLTQQATTSSANCTDRIWLESIVNPSVADWMAAARKIVMPGDLDVTKRFTDYRITFPAFNQLCDDITVQINEALERGSCAQRLALPDAWRLQHQSDVITAFAEAVVSQIISP